MSIYLAIDLGTTGCRSILFDDKLNLLGMAYEEYGLITKDDNCVEQDAVCWWKLTLKTMKQAISESGIDAKDIESISISSQGITMVPVDENIEPLCNALSWLDVRAQEECAQIEADFGRDYVYKLTGKPIDACYTLPKILWLKKHCPDIYSKAWKILMPLDFLIGKLTGNCVTDHSMASGTLCYDIKNTFWCKQILDYYEIDESKLPNLCWSGEKAGCVLPEVAQELGLSENCIVAVGAQDQKCAAFGAGLSEGVMTISLGTAAAITKYWKEAKTEQNNGVGWCGYAEPNTWVTEGVINTAGTCLRWLRDTIYNGESYKTIDNEALDALSKGSSLLFYPYMNGPSSPDYYPDAEGSFYGVNLATKRGDFALAVMEGIAFQIRILLEAMEAYGNVNTLILFGGGANGSVWPQIIADVIGMQVKIPQTTEAASAGAIILAAKASGNIIEPLACGKTFFPSDRAKSYDEKYKKYRRLEKSIWGCKTE